ncbi:hypothetical protein [Desulforamulus ferrireducens]|uniref:Uncharacterized protein n=1 Tax=Desulforamulus ferrireducens TaxID=1833852 RepID=A0A1S6IUV3_9FIRM|nr:hypothetical protein [Desulforamulus ferrireducens]AQS58560.1 hypothetical protein B0537_05335 [Desulforamulus ferrireducens]
MSCSTCTSGNMGGISVGGSENVTELIKVVGIEQANRLLAEGHFFVSMYFNEAKQEEVYILGSWKPIKKERKPIGFIPRD